MSALREVIIDGRDLYADGVNTAAPLEALAEPGGISQTVLNRPRDKISFQDEDVAEQALRHIALGRKNWLFAGSAKGAETAAILFTVTSSCHRHGVDAFAYLRDLLERLAHDGQPSAEQLRAWLPDRWQPPPPESADST